MTRRKRAEAGSDNPSSNRREYWKAKYSKHNIAEREGAEMPKGELQTINRRFDETVIEIRQLLQQKKELIPHAPTEELGKPIEMFTRNYGETVAEIHRIELIKILSERFK
ncbi:MAG: hypothetical protein QW112_00455 [Candidatus Micrarchaeia archaeon]